MALLMVPGLFSSAVRAEDNKEAIEAEITYTELNRQAEITWTTKSQYEVVKTAFLYGEYKDATDSAWNEKAEDVSDCTSVTVDKEGCYSFRFIDSIGHIAIYSVDVSFEFRAYWFAYSDYKPGQTKAEFTEYFRKVCKNAVSQNMTAIAAHARMFSDAMYKSKYYPWSKYASGKQGVDPGYDPLKIMVSLAHEYGLELHAWLNPYRVAKNSTDITILSDDNPAKKWLTDDDPSNDRNVLIYGGNIYLNPSKKAVRTLIVNGIKEIVKKYDVDGIHFDDYFYPEWLGPEYKSNFDAQEYNEYAAGRAEKGKKAMDIVKWRRNNVNTLLKTIYKSIKKINPDVVFGVSPGGYLDHLTKVDRNYVDYPTWLSSDEYMDYICPQVYWSFNKANTFPYAPTVDRWIAARSENCHVKIYIGIAVYKCGIKSEKGWTGKNVLARMINTARETGNVDGFMFFDYKNMVDPGLKKYINPLMKVLQESR